MCGLVGYFKFKQTQVDAERDQLKRMADAIRSRGPDSEGYWVSPDSLLGFGHRRLAIVDLSSNGDQPMISGSGRYVIVFNGEIYNHLLLRNQLENHGNAPMWRGHSDTETLLAGFDAWGIRKTIERAIGMFAFAVWDKQNGVLTIGRDRMGEKPLYYGWQSSGGIPTFLFGSELKSIRQHAAFEGKVNRGALCLLLRDNYIPSPYSIYEEIYKLPPGCLLTLSRYERAPNIEAYWSSDSISSLGELYAEYNSAPHLAVDALDTLLRDAVRQQMMADVPLGAFLSGGVDSSTVVALMQAQSNRPVKTFTIGFHEQEYNEAHYAKQIAAHLGTDHTELYVSPSDALGVIPKLPSLYDEPFSDSSQIPTYLVAQLARSQVTVTLSGDGGDELFCGYERYVRTEALWEKLASSPLLLRKMAAWAATSLSPQLWNMLTGRVSGLLPRSLRGMNGHKLHKGASILDSDSIIALYLGLMSHWRDPASAVIGGTRLPAQHGDADSDAPGLGGIERLMKHDMQTYLPDDILVKVDRAAMGVSLETRVPFLDHRVVELSAHLSQSVKVRDGQPKWILRQVLSRYVPMDLIDRPKMGFAVPVKAWLRGPLRDWAEALLDESRLRREGYFVPELVRTKWREHLSGEQNWETQLWTVLMYQSWLEQST